MTCLCPSRLAPLSSLTPKVSLSVGAVPMQMPGLVAMLGMGAPGAGAAMATSRLDLKMSGLLSGMMGQPWLPTSMPTLLTMSAQMSSLAALFPLHDINALIAELQQMLASLRAHVLPIMAGAAALPKLAMANMVMAARMTLSMRLKGLCPMSLSGLDHSFAAANNLAPPTATFNAAVNASARMGGAGMPGFGLPLPQLGMAMSLAAVALLASLPASLGLPAVGSTDFAGAAMAALARLASIPALPLDLGDLMSQLARLSDLAAIQQAFGMDAMTSAGVSRVQAMLNFMGGLRLPSLPAAVLALQPKLDMLPTMEAVQTGAQVARLNVSTVSSAMRLSPMRPPILSALMALNALKAVLADALGVPAMSGCAACKMAA